MTPRERILTALNRKVPDKVPIDMGSFVTGITKVAYNKLLASLGIDETVKTLDVMQQLAWPSENILKLFKVDTRYLITTSADDIEKNISDGKYTDEWGLKYKLSSNNLYFEMYDYPLSGITSRKELDSYQFPDIEEQKVHVVNAVDQMKEKYTDKRFAICSEIYGSIFQRAWSLMGLEKFMLDVSLNLPLIEALFDKILNYWERFFKMLFTVTGDFLDVIWLEDDLSSQQGPLISPSLYRQILKPRLKQIVNSIQNLADVKIVYHSCGAVDNFITDLIDVGIDALNPIQVSAIGMNTAVLKEKYGDHLAFWGGGCDTQSVLPFGTENEVRKEVIRRIDDLAPGGGYIFNTVHNIQADVPPDNVISVFKTAADYGGSFYN